MLKNFKKAGLLAVLVSAALSAPAQAYVIDFEGPALANLYGGFEALRFGEYNFWFQSDGGLIGTVDDLAPATAPTGNASQFALALNTGIVSFWKDDFSLFRLRSFDLAYVPHPNAPPLNKELVLVIDSHEDQPIVWGLSGNEGANPFVHINEPGLFAWTSSMNMFVCEFDPVTRVVCDGGISSGQFAFDNVVLEGINDVPEPASWALASLALLAGGVAAQNARRRT